MPAPNPLVRFLPPGSDSPRHAWLSGDSLAVIESDGLKLPDLSAAKTGEQFFLSEVTLLAPVVPGQILCVGRNYQDHAAEMKQPVPTSPLIFNKLPGSLQRPGGNIERPDWVERVDYEGEIAIVIGKTCRNVTEANAMQSVWGVTCANDVTGRSLQSEDGQWTRAKGFDTFCPLGPGILPIAHVDWNTLQVETRLNGQVVQRGCTADFIFPAPMLVAYISQFCTLQPGDVILTGTPAGVGALAKGDVVSVSATGIGTLENPVA